ncbi:hypothetical protein Tco_0567098 [Tanacetum coccineum]
MNVEALQTKYPIIDWEIYTEGARKYWKIIRVGNHTEVYQFFDDMLKAFDREDLVKLWSLVKEKFTSTEPTEDKEREIWVELKRLFEPDIDDELWKLQKHIHDNLTWKLYDSCGVHHVSTEDGIDIYMLVEKEYPLSRGTLTLMLVAKLLVEQDSEMSRELLRKIFMQLKNRSYVGINRYTSTIEMPDYRMSQCAKTPSEVQRMRRVPYASAIGSIMYAVRWTRPDVAFANTKDMVLVYGTKPEAELKVSFVDWKSAKQSTTAMSSTEAEYIAAAEASMEAV